MERGLLLDLWGTLFWPKLPLEEYHLMRAKMILRILDQGGLSLDAVYKAYMDARRLADKIRNTTLHEVDVVGEAIILLDKLGIEPTGDLLRELEEAYIRPYVTQLELAPGAVELIRTAREHGFRVILASNTMSGRHTRTLLMEKGLLDLFDYLAFSDEIGFRKPHPKFFSAIVHQTGISPSRSVFVGDEEGDIAGARAFGMKTIAFIGFHEYSGGVAPDYFAKSMYEVAEIIKVLSNA